MQPNAAASRSFIQTATERDLSVHHIAPAKRFEAIIRPHFDALYATARRLTLSTVDAEDLVQEVCLKSFMRLDELEVIEHQRAWLLKMLYHKFIDERRASRRSATGNADTGLDSIDPDELMQNDNQPEKSVDEDIRITRILMAMKKLNVEHCALVGLRDIEGMSIAELEKATGLKSGTIKAQLHRTRVKLGKILLNDESLRPDLKAIGADK